MTRKHQHVLVFDLLPNRFSSRVDSVSSMQTQGSDTAADRCPQYPRHGLGKILIPENDARPPLAVYFGRILGNRHSKKGQGRIEEYSLKRHVYLGPTSMDAELSFIMTNLGQVKKESFCMDPFGSTGSILVSCALQGTYCFRTDIDLRVLRGKSQEENVKSNF